jgi:hypothetical protein
MVPSSRHSLLCSMHKQCSSWFSHTSMSCMVIAWRLLLQPPAHLSAEPRLPLAAHLLCCACCCLPFSCSSG